MRVKFEATDATGKVHKHGSRSRVYSHCVVIHFAAHPQRELGFSYPAIAWFTAAPAGGMEWLTARKAKEFGIDARTVK